MQREKELDAEIKQRSVFRPNVTSIANPVPTSIYSTHAAIKAVLSGEGAV